MSNISESMLLKYFGHASRTISPKQETSDESDELNFFTNFGINIKAKIWAKKYNFSFKICAANCGANFIGFGWSWCHGTTTHVVVINGENIEECGFVTNKVKKNMFLKQ